MKRIKLFLLTVSSFTAFGCMTSVMAAMPLPSGWYLEGNLGGTRTSNASYGGSYSVTNTGLGGNINVGYKFLPYFAGEIGYTRYSKGKISSSGTQIAQTKDYSYDLAGKAILPVADSGFELFSKLGIARLTSKVSATNSSYIAANGLTVNTGTHTVTAAYLGVGGEYYITPSFAVNVQWNRAKGNSTTGNLDLYSAGISYLFS